jgi:hypothetical protein
MSVQLKILKKTIINLKRIISFLCLARARCGPCPRRRFCPACPTLKTPCLTRVAWHPTCPVPSAMKQRNSRRGAGGGGRWGDRRAQRGRGNRRRWSARRRRSLMRASEAAASYRRRPPRSRVGKATRSRSQARGGPRGSLAWPNLGRMPQFCRRPRQPHAAMDATMMSLWGKAGRYRRRWWSLAGHETRPMMVLGGFLFFFSCLDFLINQVGRSPS